jgi:hypothetical protein
MAMSALIGCEELTTPQDQYFNYCWWNYAPIAPTANKLRPVNLLFQSFAEAQMNERAMELVDALRQTLGLFRTVFGIKFVDGRLVWEFYFYDYKRRERDASMTRVTQALAPYARCGIVPNERLPYFMFSIDIDSQLVCGQRDLDVIHMYLGNPGSSVSSGVAYGVRERSVELENFYFFFDARKQLPDAAAKVACSPWFDASRVHIDQVLWPQLRNCHTICIANKRTNDTVYFSGVNVQQLLFFLRSIGYHDSIVNFVEQNQPRLDHLLYDVGFDYVRDGDRIRIVKSGYYGVF